VLNNAQLTRFVGQTGGRRELVEYILQESAPINILIEGGETKKRRATPPIENPMSWVDITTNL
jgi:hypothetical protein